MFVVGIQNLQCVLEIVAYLIEAVCHLARRLIVTIGVVWNLHVASLDATLKNSKTFSVSAKAAR